MAIDSDLVAAIQSTIDSAFDYKMDNVHTAIPCIVIAVRNEGSTQMVDIQPTINQRLPDGTVKERPPILGVPISFPISSNGGMTYPITVGTTGMAQFSMRDMESWKAGNGRPSTPQTAGRMSASDAVFQPGIQPPGSAINNPSKHVLTHNTQDVVMFGNLGAAEAEVRIKADGSIEINTSNHPVTINCSVANINANEEVNINSPKMTVDVPDITVIGNITHIGNTTQTGDYSHTGNYAGVGIQTFNSIVFSTHKHISAAPGSPTGVPIP